MNTRVKGFIYLLLSAVYFGFMPLLVKVICADGSTIVGALFLRFALAIIPLYIYLKVRKVPIRDSLRQPQPVQPSLCQQQRSVFATIQLFQPCQNIATDRKSVV